MTAFAIDFKRDRIAIAADTLAYIPDRQEARPLGYLSKVFPVPHLRAVVFCRGMLQIAAAAAGVLALSPDIATLEQAAAALPDILADVTARYADEQGIDDPDALSLAEVALVGYSDAERRCRAWYFFNADGYEPQDDGGAHYGLLMMPRLADADMPALSGSADRQLVAAMLAEQKFFAAHPEAMGGMRLGGEIQRWQIDRDGISQRVIHRFADFEQVRHAGAAVTARIMRGDEAIDVAAGLVPVAESRFADEIAASGGSPAERRRAEKAARPREMSRAERKAARRSRAA